MEKYTRFNKELAELLNSYGIDNDTNTPDFILAGMISDIILSIGIFLNRRDKRNGFKTPIYNFGDNVIVTETPPVSRDNK